MDTNLEMRRYEEHKRTFHKRMRVWWYVVASLAFVLVCVDVFLTLANSHCAQGHWKWIGVRSYNFTCDRIDDGKAQTDAGVLGRPH